MNVQDPLDVVAGETAAEAVNVQVTGVPVAGVAVIVTVAPGTKAPTLIVGVLSFVNLSVVELPVSDPESSVGVPVVAVHCAYKVIFPVD